MLNLVLAVIAGMQAPIIMMSQNRQGEKDRLRADLDFQVNLKNELSLTEVLRRLDVLESERLPQMFLEQNEKIANGGRTAAIASSQAVLKESRSMIHAIIFDFNGHMLHDTR